MWRPRAGPREPGAWDVVVYNVLGRFRMRSFGTLMHLGLQLGGAAAAVLMLAGCPAAEECRYGEQTHAVGAVFASSDGCNTCSCEAGGSVACTLRGCVAPDAGTHDGAADARGGDAADVSANADASSGAETGGDSLTDAGAGDDAGPDTRACVQNALCVRGGHFDRQICQCVAGDDAGGGDDGGHNDTPRVIVTAAACGTTIPAKLGAPIVVSLASTYWQFKPATPARVLQQRGETVYAPGASCPPFPGSGCGTATATFDSVADGTAVISATRGSCGEALACAHGEGQDRCTITVIVAR